MAFKKMKQVKENMYGNRLVLDDEHSVTGVFLYKDYEDVLLADAHYVNTKKYKGYVHCCEEGCPACKKGIRVQEKLFIPFLVLADKSDGYEENTVIFWDRNKPFDYQLRKDVFDKYPNPTSVVFRITRHGGYRDRSTTYSIMPVANFTSDIDEVLSSMNVSFPDYYENIVKDVDAVELSDWLNESSDKPSDSYTPAANYSYQVKPRKRMADPEDLDELEASEDLPGEEVDCDDVDSNVASAELPDFAANSSANKEGKKPSPSFESFDSDDSDDDDCEPTF